MLKIYPAETNKDIEMARAILEEYLAWRKSENTISAQESEAFEKQLAELPAEFAPPGGCLLLAEYKGQTTGCVCLRDLGDGVCEMKRLYVKQEFRRLKIGKALAEAVIEQARKIGHTRMRIDTFDDAAKVLYASLGFKEIEPYRHNPIEGVVFMELRLV